MQIFSCFSRHGRNSTHGSTFSKLSLFSFDEEEDSKDKENNIINEDSEDMVRKSFKKLEIWSELISPNAMSLQ